MKGLKKEYLSMFEMEYNFIIEVKIISRVYLPKIGGHYSMALLGF